MSTRFEEKDFSDQGFNLKVWKQLFTHLKPYKKIIIILAFMQIGFSIADVLLPYLSRIAVDELATKAFNSKTFISFLITFILLIAYNGIGNYIYFRLIGRIEMGFGYDLRKKAFDKLQSLSFSYYDTTPTGWLLARITSDISRLAEVLSWSFIDVFWGIPVSIIATVVMLQSSVKLTVIILVAMPFLGILTYYFQMINLKQYRHVRKANSKVTNDFNEGINGAKTSKTLVLEDKNNEEFVLDTHELKTVAVKAQMLGGIFRPLVKFISSFVLAITIWIGADLSSQGIITLGTLMMFIQYAQLFFQPIQQMAFMLSEFQMAQASGERVLYMLDAQPSIVDSDEVIEKYGTVFEPKTENYEPIKGDIEFKDVDFSYIEDQPILQHFNLKVKAGQTVALVGETGSGKSTIVNLLCRFYEPTAGKICIDGSDYRNRSIGWLHSNLGYVLQAPHLFSGTIRENVRFGRLDASDEEVENACKLVNAHEFIMGFDQGYDTQVGEGGSRLSTGQKQLISFARAVLADPAIFVLDEATSSIDTETEQIIQHAIETLMKDKTSFVVAHRLSTIVNSDMILVIKNGKIVEQGTHSELLSLKGYYYSLYTTQFNEMVTSTSWEEAVVA